MARYIKDKEQAQGMMFGSIFTEMTEAKNPLKAIRQPQKKGWAPWTGME